MPVKTIYNSFFDQVKVHFSCDVLSIVWCYLISNSPNKGVNFISLFFTKIFDQIDYPFFISSIKGLFHEFRIILIFVRIRT
jgi:hypothetical protein